MATHPLIEPPAIRPEEFLMRQRSVKAAAAVAQLDALLVWSSGGSSLDAYADVFYLANHYSQVPRVNLDIPGLMSGWGGTALIVPTGSAPTVLIVESSDWRPDLVVADTIRESHDLIGEVIAALRDVGLGSSRLGVVGLAHMPAAEWLRLTRELPKIQLEDVAHILFAHRMVKSPAEVAMMRHATSVGAAIQNAMMDAAAVGKTDNDLARAAYEVCLDYGAVPYDFAFASGPASAHGYWSRLPAWDRRRRYEPGDIVHPDAYGCVNGYFYDLQRTTVVGGPNSAQLRLLEGVVGVVEALCQACRPGVPVAQVALLRDQWLADHGFIQAPTESLSQGRLSTPLVASGHGLGLGFELPWVYPGSKDVLQTGMTLSLEVYLTEPGVGTVVNEEVILVTEGSPEILTIACPARQW
jgi:Xaa-Pro aminopeptidase